MKPLNNITTQKEFAFHMENIQTGERRIKKVKTLDVTQAFCKDVGYGKEWSWTGSEPWRNVSDHVQHIGNGYYKLKLEE